MTKQLIPDYIGHRKRIKERYKTIGLDNWSDYEVLEFALSFALPRKDTKPIAKELISKFKSIDKVLNANKEELVKVKGISEHAALFLSFLKDISRAYLKKALYNQDLLSSPDAVYNYLKAALKGLADEEFKVLFLDNRNHLLTVETLQTGTVNKSVVYPRKVVERALHNHAASVIIAHNHPAGSLKPSGDDIKVTKTIKDALRIVEIELLDHILIGGNGYFSFIENGVVF